MIPYGRQSIDASDIDAVVKVLKSDWLTQGPKVLEFEQALARYCGARYAVAASSGTAALHLAYRAADLKGGDEAITTPNTFVATTNMLLEVGAKPVFCDIRLDTYNIDERNIESLITNKTRAVVPVHFAGQPCAMDKIRKISQRHDLVVIEDACHALGARYKHSKIGDCAYSDMAVFSFHPVKSITTGEGGAVLTNSKNLYQRLLLLRSHGVKKDKRGFNIMTELGYNYRLSDIQAALGASQIKKIGGFIKKRRQVVKWYQEELAGINAIILPVELKECLSAWHIYVIRVREPKHRLPLYQHLKKHGIGVNFHYPAVYSQPYYRKKGYKSFYLKNEELYQSSCLTLPCFPALKRSEVRYIGRTIRKFFN